MSTIERWYCVLSFALWAQCVWVNFQIAKSAERKVFWKLFDIVHAQRDQYRPDSRSHEALGYALEAMKKERRK